MHILLVNDDGIHAPGIRTLAQTLAARGHRVSVCAPDRERSAASHSITLREAIAAQRVELPGAEIAYAATGTPADCARLGLYLIPDAELVISGINNGPNLGGACIYSGTVGAATEAAMSGVPALATSLCAFSSEDYFAAAEVTARVAEWMTAHPLRRGEIYNLNVPPLPYGEIRGVRAAVSAPNFLDSAVYREVETEDGVVYRYALGENVPIEDPVCDQLLMEAGYATLTKLTWDLRADADDPDVSALAL